MRANFLPAIVVAAASFALFRCVYLRCRRPAIRAALAIVALDLSVPAWLIVSNYVLMVPFEQWFVDLRSIPGFEISSGLTGALLGVIFASGKLRPGRLNGPVLIVSSVTAAVLVTTPFISQLYWAVDYRALRDSWKDGVCVQSSSYTCIPACIATLARLNGVRLTEPELAREMGSTVRGTEVWYLKRALKAHGLEPRFLSLKSPRDAPVPSMLSVTLTGISHVVVVLRKDAQGLTIAEPMIGRREYAWDVFRRCYRPDGSCVTIRRTSLQPSPRKRGCLYYPLLAEGGPGGGYSDSVHIPL